MSILQVFSLVAVATTVPRPQVATPTKGLNNIGIGDPVPAFSVHTLDGAVIESKTYQGKVLLVVFARPDHEKSLRALKVAQEILTANTGSGLSVLAVSTKQDAGDCFGRIAAEFNITYPIGVDPERKMYGDFGVFVAPTTVLIDEAGVLRFVIPHTPISYDRRLRLHIGLMLGRISQAEHERKLSQTDETAAHGQDSWTRRLGLAQRLVDQGKFEQAMPILEKLIGEKDTAAAPVLMGTCLLNLGRIAEAAQYLDPLSDRQFKSPKVKLSLARLELSRGNDQAAEQYLRDALKVSPTKGPILYQLGRLHERRGELHEAVQCYRNALEEVFADS
ncbi:MAG: tetratricopeptide repeat protein [Phycisphaerales bacterium]|nr:MAG: tetratricopeptide repeat protein [Phycisphaerales bacterium]